MLICKGNIGKVHYGWLGTARAGARVQDERGMFSLLQESAAIVARELARAHYAASAAGATGAGSVVFARSGCVSKPTNETNEGVMIACCNAAIVRVTNSLCNTNEELTGPRPTREGRGASNRGRRYPGVCTDSAIFFLKIFH